MFKKTISLPAKEEIKSNENKIIYLEGLRGVAAFLVVVHHFLIAFYPAHYTAVADQFHIPGNIEALYCVSFFNIFTNGNFAVCLFFVLSGYVLSYKYYESNSSSTLISLAMRRYIRLLVPVFFTILVAGVMMNASLFYNKEAIVFTKSGWWMENYWNFHPSFKDIIYTAFIETFIFVSSSFSTTTWTICWEFYGSLLLLAFLALTHNLRNRYIIYLLLIFLPFLIPMDRHYFAAFLLGAFLHTLVPFYNTIQNNHIKTSIKIFILILGLLFGSVPSSGLKIDSTYQLLYFNRNIPLTEFYHIFGAFFCLFFVLLSQKTQTFLSHRLCIFFGTISFSMYLIHPLLIGSLACFMFLKLHPFYSYNIVAPFTILISIAATIFVSYMMTIWVDKPGIKFSNYFYKKWFASEKPMNHSSN